MFAACAVDEGRWPAPAAVPARRPLLAARLETVGKDEPDTRRVMEAGLRPSRRTMALPAQAMRPASEAKVVVDGPSVVRSVLTDGRRVRRRPHNRLHVGVVRAPSGRRMRGGPLACFLDPGSGEAEVSMSWLAVGAASEGWLVPAALQGSPPGTDPRRAIATRPPANRRRQPRAAAAPRARAYAGARGSLRAREGWCGRPRLRRTVRARSDARAEDGAPSSSRR